MSYTNFPNGITSFGTPAPGSHYAGWWGKNVWFVDDDTGGDEVTRKGNSPGRALKTIQEAITRSGPGDTIFLKPREIDTDTHSSHGYYSGTNIIPTGKQGLAIIGTGRGVNMGSAAQCMVEPTAACTTATITVQSPGVCIENLGVKAISGSKGAISANVSTAQAYGLTVSNCFFKDFIGTTGYGSIHTETTHWVTIQHCIFREGGVGIKCTSLIAALRNLTIKDCDFLGKAATWSNDIYVGDVWGLIIDNCRFGHAIPAAGATMYITCNGVLGNNHGMISNCKFSIVTTDEAACMTLVSGILNANCYGDDTVLT